VSKDAQKMQGLRVCVFLAVCFAWSASSLARGQPLVADVTAHRIGHDMVMIGPDGLQFSQFEIRSPGATFLKVHFTEFALPPGIVVEVGNVYGSERYRYSISSKDRFTFDPEIGDDGAHAFSAMSVSSDAIYVRLIGDLRTLDPKRHSLRIGDYLEGLPENAPGDLGRGSQTDSSCGADDRSDAVCWSGSSPDAYDRSRPVGIIVTTTGIVCTAWRVGPQNRIFTAEHCIASQADVSAAEVWFNYQASQCGGPPTSNITKVSGQVLLEVDPTLDFALFTVSNFQEIAEFGYLGLDVREGIKGERIYIPQHGYGRPKQLAVESDMNPQGFCQIDDEDHSGYAAATDLGYYCDTVASSSGAPVISAATGRAIALHHLGGCVNSGAKVSLIWPMVEAHFGGQIPSGDTEPTLHNVPPRPSLSLACKGLSCSFSGSGSTDPDGSIVSWSWDFGDRSTTSGARVSHNFSAAGTYTVTLTVTDNREGRATASRQLLVSNFNRPPPAGIKPGG